MFLFPSTPSRDGSFVYTHIWQGQDYVRSDRTKKLVLVTMLHQPQTGNASIMQANYSFHSSDYRGKSPHKAVPCINACKR